MLKLPKAAYNAGCSGFTHACIALRCRPRPFDEKIIPLQTTTPNTDDEHATSPISCYVVDDNDIDRAVAVRLASEAGLKTRFFNGGQSFLTALPTLEPGVVLLDVMMPEVDGAAVLATLTNKNRGDIVLMMSAQADVATAVATMRNGAQDFLLKPLESSETTSTLLRAVENMRDNKTIAVDQKKVQETLRSITPKEMVVLRKLIAGKRNKNVAHELGVSERTVEVHRSRLIRRAESGTFAGLIAFAVKAGVEPDLS